ncbi:MAG: hypothetical protein IKH13_04090 [Clostridia bacterium]|nr:hypothetical protein [Clostridia bacterium]
MKKALILFTLPALVFTLVLPAYAQQGSIKVGENLPVNPAIILVGMFIGAIAGVITVFIFRNKLKSVSFKSEADEYLRNGSFNLTESKDIFIDKQTERSLRTKNSGIIDGLRND